MATAAVLGGGLLGGAGSIMGGIAANEQSKKQAQLLKRQGRIEADDIRTEGRQINSAVANRGDGANTGSALDIALDNAVQSEVEAMQTLFGFKKRAGAARDAGRASLVSGAFGGASSILGSSALAYSMRPDAATPSTSGGSGTAGGLNLAGWARRARA